MIRNYDCSDDARKCGRGGGGMSRSIAAMVAAAAGRGADDDWRPVEWHFDRGVYVSGFVTTITRMIDTRVNRG